MDANEIIVHRMKRDRASMVFPPSAPDWSEKPFSQSDIRKFGAKTGLYTACPARSAAGSGMSVRSQPSREKSLVLKCAGNRRNSSDISKGIF